MITRVALYARVSSELQMEGFSIEAQLRAMREYARAEGWEIVREYVDEGVSAGTAKRPQFQVLLRDANLRLFDGLLVHKLDRLYRNLSQLLEMVGALEKQGISLVSTTERVDFGSPSGKMLLTNIGMISEFYLNNLKEETIKGKYQRVLSGLWNGEIPFGYCKGLCSRCDDPNGNGYCPNYGKADLSSGKKLIAHPKDSLALQLAFELYAQGHHSDQVLADELNARGYRPRWSMAYKLHRMPEGERKFTKESLRAILQNPFYLGYVKYKGQLYAGTQPPLIAPEVFEACKIMRRRWFRRPAQRRSQHTFYLLSSVIRCAACGHVMRAMKNPRGMRYYRDTAREYGVVCVHNKMANAERVEPQVLAQLKRIVLPEEWKTRVLQLTEATAENAQAKETQRMLHSRLERLQKLYLQGDMSEQAYERQKQRIEAELSRLFKRQPAISQDTRARLDHFDSILAMATPEEKKRMIQMLLRAVHVQEHSVTLEPRRAFAKLFRDRSKSV